MEIPDSSNFYCALATSLSVREVAELFEAAGWEVRVQDDQDHVEIHCPWAELAIESASPILMHGPVANVAANAEQVLAALKQANVAFTAECYGPDGKLLREWRGVSAETGTSRRRDPLVHIFKETERRSDGAYFWDSLRDEVPAWNDLEYEWIASSCFGDQIILTSNSPIHDGPALYMHGPDVAGPDSADPNWLDNILYLGSSEEEWLARIGRFGDEHSVTPGAIDQSIREPEAYRKIYRDLNPGLRW